MRWRVVEKVWVIEEVHENSNLQHPEGRIAAGTLGEDDRGTLG